ncbi:MAG: hypothetical protein WCE65_00875 [Methanoregula sp.]
MTGHITLPNLITKIQDYYRLTPVQIENVTRLKKISDHFNKRMGLPSDPSEKITSDTVILESGHQPNFLPHCGTWKKAFLLDRIYRKLQEKGIPAIAFFGLADQNQSTARLLSRNSIPDFNKKGSLVIGFRIKEPDKYTGFASQKKPDRDEWEKEMSQIKTHYQDMLTRADPVDRRIQPQLETLMEIIEDCYEKAETFADLNSRIFTRISHDILELKLSFFSYYDLQRENLFLEESRRLLDNFQDYSRIYNNTVVQEKLDIPVIEPTELPLWYHCTCGRKLSPLLKESMTAEAVCPTSNCHHRLSFEKGFHDLKNYYANMDFRAVSREIIISEAIGNSLYISGSGGSLIYGRISRQIADALAFHRPLTAYWRSDDNYLGLSHVIVLKEMMKLFSLKIDDVENSNLAEKTKNVIKSVELDLETAAADVPDKKTREIFNLKRRLNSLTMVLNSANQIFSSPPSAFDVIVSTKPETITGLWDSALNTADILYEGDQFSLDVNIDYPPFLLPEIAQQAVPVIYHSLKKLGVAEK